MKYYSEKTKKLYDTIEDFKAGEDEFDKIHEKEIAKAKERKARASEVENAYKEIVTATKKYNKLVEKFVKDYGSYHFSYNSENLPLLGNSLAKLWEEFFLK